MLRIPCPWCGLRDETEFRYGGESRVRRPGDPRASSDREWAEYLFYRDNTKGVLLERWFHVYGCRQWFNAARDTVTHEFLGAYGMGEAAPDTGEEVA